MKQQQYHLKEVHRRWENEKEKEKTLLWVADI